MRIRLFDNDGCFYPLIIIRDGTFRQFMRDLNEYRKQNIDEYNIDDFLEILETKKYFIEYIDTLGDKEVFF